MSGTGEKAPEGFDPSTGEVVDIGAAFGDAPAPAVEVGDGGTYAPVPPVQGPAIPQGFKYDPETAQLVQTEPTSREAALQARDYNMDARDAPFPTQPAGAGLSGQGPTAADAAQTRLEQAAANDLPITQNLLLNRLPTSPIGLDITQRNVSAPRGGQGGMEFEVSGKNIPDDPYAKKLVQQGAAMQIAARADMLQKQYDALTGQAGYLSQLQQEFGEFDDDTAQQLEKLAEQENQKIDQINNLVAEARTRTVNPAAFYGNAGAGSAFAAGIATAVGAVTSAWGGLNENAAGRIIEQAVESNIRAQEMSIAQANFADQMESNLLQQIRATVANRTQARSVLRAMLYNQAELEFQRQTAVARREQVPGMKQAIAGQLQQAAGQAMLDYNKERASEFSIKGKTAAAFNRAQRMVNQQAQPAQQAQQGGQRRAGGGGQRANAKPKSSMQVAQDEQQVAQNMKLEREALAQIQANTFGAPNEEQASAFRLQEAQRAAAPLIKAALEAQAASGKPWTSAEAQQYMAQHPLLAAAMHSPEMLRIDKIVDTVTVSSGIKKVDLGIDKTLASLREKNRDKFLETKHSAGLNLGILHKAENMRKMLEKIGPEVMGGLLTAGPDGWKAPARGTADFERLKGIQTVLMEVINAMRNNFKGGALHGPGEFKIFEKMTAQMNDMDAFVSWLSKVGPVNATSSWNASVNAIQQFFEAGLENNGFITNESYFTDRETFGSRINNVLTQ